MVRCGLMSTRAYLASLKRGIYIVGGKAVYSRLEPCVHFSTGASLEGIKSCLFSFHPFWEIPSAAAE